MVYHVMPSRNSFGIGSLIMALLENIFPVFNKLSKRFRFMVKSDREWKLVMKLVIWQLLMKKGKYYDASEFYFWEGWGIWEFFTISVPCPMRGEEEGLSPGLILNKHSSLVNCVSTRVLIGWQKCCWSISSPTLHDSCFNFQVTT